ncbi:hypothetical protein ACOSQ2_029642 [Xanthoceras sorbifolium]
MNEKTEALSHENSKLCWKAGYKKIMVETDCKVAVDLINNSICNSPLFSIINCCKELIAGQWDCSINHTYREANRAADSLASTGHSRDLGISIFSYPPCISCVLEEDLRGSGVVRPLCLV